MTEVIRRAWTMGEQRSLMEMMMAGLCASEIAQRLNRTVASVRDRAKLLRRTHPELPQWPYMRGVQCTQSADTKE